VSRALLAPGIRTTPRRDWRSGVGVAVSMIAGDPTAWLLGMMGFAARGGTILLILPAITVPSPVVLSVLFRGEVGALSPGDVGIISMVVGSVLSVLAIGGVLLSSYAELTLAERVMRDAETLELRLGRDPRVLTRAERRSLLSWIAAIQAAALLPIILGITLLVDRIARLVTAELLAPSAVDVPLAARVLPGAASELAVAAVAIVVAGICASLATRRLIAAAVGLLPDGPARGSERQIALGALARIVRSPGRVLATALVGWALLLATLAIVVVGASIAWAAVRDVVAAGGAADDPGVAAVTWLIVGVFCSVWLGGLVVVGCVSAIRSTLWTVDTLR
jgi:hypothetical protein